MSLEKIKRPKIFLTGANGQVGYEIWQVLNPIAEVYAFKGPHDRAAAVPAQTLNLADKAALEAAIEQVDPDLIVNAAAYTAVDRAESDRELAFQVNAEAPALMGRLAKSRGAAVLHFSTDYVYPGVGEDPYREDDATGPINVYGESKLLGEQLLASSGAEYITLRTSWVYGVYGHNFVKTMLRLGQSRAELRVVDDQHGVPTSARTLANFVGHVVYSGLHSDLFDVVASQRGVYHLTDRGCTSWYGFAEEIFRIARSFGAPLALQNLSPCASSEYPTPAQRPHNSRLSLSKIEESFGFYPPRWQEALAPVLAPLLGQ